MFKWYALRVRGGKGEKIKKDIEEAITNANFENYFSQIVLPYEKVYTKTKKKGETKKKYLSYLFISIDLDTVPSIKNVIVNLGDVYGFVGLSGWGGKQEPEPVSPKEIDRMLGKVQEIDSAADFIDQTFLEGQKVKILRPLFEGKIGTIRKIIKSQKKLVVAAKVFKDYLTELELGYQEVKRID